MLGYSAQSTGHIKLLCLLKRQIPKFLDNFNHITREDLKWFLRSLMRKLLKVKLFFSCVFFSFPLWDAVLNKIPWCMYLNWFTLQVSPFNNSDWNIGYINIMSILLHDFNKLYYHSNQVANFVYNYPILFNAISIAIILILILCCSFLTKW